MESIGFGRQSDVYEHDGQAFKVYKDWVSIEQIQYEADISQKVAAVCSFAPEFYGMIEQDGKYTLKFEYIKGNMLAAVLGRNLFKLKKNAQRLGKLHRQVHENTVSGLRTTADKFERSLLQYKYINQDNLNKLMEFLKKSEKAVSLCHGDLHPENVIVEDNGKMRVIDWVDAYCGDPLSDVARTYYLLKHGTPPGEKPNFLRTVEQQAKVLIGREYLKSYFNGNSIPVKDLDMWGLIIRIHRYWEGIEEEKEALEESIAFGIEHLLNHELEC